MKKGILFGIICALFYTTLMAQSQGCWTYNPTTGAWVNNCAVTSTPPLVIPAGKQLTVMNNLTLLGNEFARLNIGAGGTLGTAAFTNTTQYQPAGAAVGYASYSTTSVTVGTGATSFTTGVGLSYATNMVLTAYYASNAAVFMQGSVTSYNAKSGALVLNVTNTGGSGTYSTWNISISGPQGVTGSAGAAGVPVGSMVEWPASTVPTNWIWADCSCIDQTTYSTLYAVIGNTWDTVDACVGATDFGLPCTLGMVAIGAGQGATHEGGGTGTNRVVGTTGGAETHTQTIAEMAAHAHAGSFSYAPNEAWMNTAGSASNYTSPLGSAYFNNTVTIGGRSQAANSLTIASEGSGTPMTIMNPFYVVKKIIRYN